MVTIDLFVRGFEGCDLLTWEAYYTILAAGRMLKKSPVSPAQPRHPETCLCPGIVRASLRGSTYGLGQRLFLQAMGGRVKTVYASPFRSLRPCSGKGASLHAGAGRVRRMTFLNIL
jgi:hypothetical protein